MPDTTYMGEANTKVDFQFYVIKIRGKGAGLWGVGRRMSAVVKLLLFVISQLTSKRTIKEGKLI